MSRAAAIAAELRRARKPSNDGDSAITGSPLYDNAESTDQGVAYLGAISHPASWTTAEDQCRRCRSPVYLTPYDQSLMRAGTLPLCTTCWREWLQKTAVSASARVGENGLE